jgi:alkylation response protein AidB-like acyl-CoA dehydrogenase
MHIAGHAAHLTPQQRELIELAATLGREKFAPRAARHDAEASFPFENYADLRNAGLLGICVPPEHGGLGADFTTYVMVAAEIGRHCGATALSWNMHVSSCMWSGFIADALDMTPEQRAEHEAHRAIHFERIVRQGKVYSSPSAKAVPRPPARHPSVRWHGRPP